MREYRAALRKDLFTVRDEEYPVTRQPFTQTRVVDRRHDRLSRAGCGDEQVAVSSASACEFHLLQQPFLKRQKDDLDRTQLKRLLGLCQSGALPEIVAIKRDEIAARPVRVEDRNHLCNHIRVADTRNPN